MQRQILNLSPMLVTSSAKYCYEKSEIGLVKAQSTDLQDTFHLIKQLEELNEPCRDNNSELFDIESLKKVLHGQHAAYFYCATLQFSLNSTQHSSDELQTSVTLLKQTFNPS